MILLLLGIMAMLSIGLIIIMAVSVGWWLLPIAIILLLFRKTFDAARKLFRKDDVVTMSRSEFEKNYVRRSDTTQVQAVK